MAALFDNHFQTVDANGLPMSGARLYFFVAGTSTALVTYQDDGATTPHANPVVADSMGLFPPIYIDTAEFKFSLQTAGGVTIQTVDPAASVLLPGYTAAGLLYGLITFCDNGDPGNDIGVGPGVCIDSTNTVFIQLVSGLVKKLDEEWSVGTNAGGRQIGAALADGSWDVYVIYRSDTGVSDVMMTPSSSPTPTLPTNYTRYRRVASFIRSAGAILRYDQYGDKFRLRTPVSDLVTTNPGTSSTLRTVTAPVRLGSTEVSADIRMAIQSTVVSQVINGSLSDTVMTDYALGALNDVRLSSLATAGTYRAETVKEVMVLGGQVRTKLDFSSAGVTLILTTYGWTDERGRFG